MKSIVVLIFSFALLFSQQNYELKLYEKILPLIFKKKSLDIYVDSDTKDILKQTNVFRIVQDCSEASLLIGRKFSDIGYDCMQKPLFATSYKSFIKQKNVIGAFYWRKSRPQIVFKNKNILKYHLYLPDSLKRFSK